jgi:hypothetical protein
MDELGARVLDVATAARANAVDPDTQQRLDEIAGRLRGPLRLAIAGKVKAGKSTLLNALLGEELAPTDAGECTRILTWYRQSDRPHVIVFPVQGTPVERPYRRDRGALDVDLGPLTHEQVDHLEVGWPTSRLRDLTLLDTPGIASISATVSARTHQVLSAEGDDAVPVADAVLYLLRHTHASDMRFLESFHDDELAHGTPMNAVGVLSRADEIGSARLDAMAVAKRVARRYEADPRMHRLCPLIVPVDGLLGHAAVTLREVEFAAVRTLAEAPQPELVELLLTADRFARRPTPLPLSTEQRGELLRRLGLFGVRLSVELVRSGAQTSAALSEALAQHSGLNELRSVVLRQFESRSRVLKARSAVAALQPLLRGDGVANSAELLARLEQIAANAHEFEEVRMLSELRSGAIEVGGNQAERLDRLLGGSGHDPASRLGLQPDASVDDVRRAALEQLASWHDVAEHPLSNRSTQLVARTATRTLEGVLAATQPAYPAESGPLNEPLADGVGDSV